MPMRSEVSESLPVSNKLTAHDVRAHGDELNLMTQKILWYSIQSNV